MNGSKIACEVNFKNFKQSFSSITLEWYLQVKFIDGGNLTKFVINETPVTIKSLSSGNKKQGMIHECIVGDEILQPDPQT